MKYSLTALLLCLATGTAFAAESKSTSATKAETVKVLEKKAEKKVEKKAEKKIEKKKVEKKKVKKIFQAQKHEDKYLSNLEKDMRKK